MPKCAALTSICCIRLENSYSPCCRYAPMTTKFIPSEVKFHEFKNSQFYQTLTSNMETGWDPGCHSCQREEDLGKQSLRQRYNQWFAADDDQVKFLDISLSSQCNIACKMCSNLSSTTWQKVVDKNPDLIEFGFQTSPTANLSTVENLINNIDLSNLKLLRYLGGEPFITPEVYDLISQLKERNIVQSCVFVCNTNSTFFPEKLIDQLESFKSIRIDFSVDGIDDLCNFIRTGSDWHTVKQVINRWIDRSKETQKYTLALHNTLQAYNLHQFDDIKSFAAAQGINFNYSILNYPEHLRLEALPKNYIDELLDLKIINDNEIINVVSNIKFDPKSFDKLVSYTAKTDSIFDTDISTVNPRLAKYLKRNGHD